MESPEKVFIVGSQGRKDFLVERKEHKDVVEAVKHAEALAYNMNKTYYVFAAIKEVKPSIVLTTKNISIFDLDH